MSNDQMTRRAIALGAGAAVLAGATNAVAQGARRDDDGTYSQSEIVAAAERFFGAGAEGVATVVAHVFEQNGRPVGYIEGGEGSGAIGVGLRYGQGALYFRRQRAISKLYWQGPSVGFDTGGNAARCFTLIYGMTDPAQIYRRFPGVEGSAYFVGGVGVNYQRADNITLAPMRAGVGFRLGANIGYLGYSRQRRILPF